MNNGTPKEVGYPPCVLSARKNMQLIVRERQRQILIGSVLGDAYIAPKGKIQIEQGAEQKTYLLWKFAELKNISYGDTPAIVTRYNKKRAKTYRSYRFWLRQYFRPWRQIFYQGKEKLFPDNLRLTSLSLAVWYMDDGSFSDRSCVLAIDAYSDASFQRIQRELWRSFRLDTRRRTNKKLLILAKDHKKFFGAIYPYIQESMEHKMP